MSYRKGLSKAKFKQTMRMFWTERWKYERSPQEWVESMSISNIWMGISQIGSSIYSSNSPYGKKTLDLLSSAIDKLILEKKLLKEQGKNLKEMLESPDKENALVAVTIMAALKPRKFKKLIKQEIKNTETNE